MPMITVVDRVYEPIRFLKVKLVINVLEENASNHYKNSVAHR